MKFSINNIEYSLKHTWIEVLLKDAVSIVELEASDDTIDGVIEGIEYEKIHYNYMIDVIHILSGTPKDILNNTDPLYLEVLFGYVRHIVKDLFYFDVSAYKPIGITEIKFKGVTYYTPGHIKIDDEYIIGYKEPSKNITEASNFMTYMADLKNRGLGVMKYVCALYLKPTHNEPYDDDRVNTRAELFEELPMSVVWDVFFYTYCSLVNCSLNTLISLRKRKGVLSLLRYRMWAILVGSILWLKQIWQGILKKLK